MSFKPISDRWAGDTGKVMMVKGWLRCAKEGFDPRQEKASKRSLIVHVHPSANYGKSS